MSVLEPIGPKFYFYSVWFPWWLSGLPDNAGDSGSIPGSGRSPGEGNGSPLQYSCLGNPMHRGAWWAAVATESDATATKQQHSLQSVHIQNLIYLHWFLQQSQEGGIFISALQDKKLRLHGVSGPLGAQDREWSGSQPLTLSGQEAQRIGKTTWLS